VRAAEPAVAAAVEAEVIRPRQAGQRGTDVMLVDLRTGRHQVLASVGDIAFNRKEDLLAYTIDDAVKDSDGLLVFDTRSGRTVSLDNDAKQYNRLAWNEDGTAIGPERRRASREAGEDARARERAPRLPQRPRHRRGRRRSRHADYVRSGKTDTFPKGWVVSARAPLCQISRRWKFSVASIREARRSSKAMSLQRVWREEAQ
jgi:hypothetical protein